MARGYIVGKMRGIRGCNFAAFDEAAEKGRGLGHTIVSPAELDREAGIIPDPNGICADAEFTQAEIDDITQRDVDAVMSLRAANGDFIAVLPDRIGSSSGGTAEIALAKFRRLKILDARTFQPLHIDIIVSMPLLFTPHKEAACFRPPDGGTIRVAKAFANGEL